MQAAELLFLICNLSLKEHLEQLQFLYDSIPQKKRVLVKKGNQFIGTMAGLQALSERMSEMLGEPDQYEEVTNENYSQENFEQFLVRMIDKKKLKIERVKDIDEENWKEEVWDKEIVPNEDYLYKKPGYSCD